MPHTFIDIQLSVMARRFQGLIQPHAAAEENTRGSFLKRDRISEGSRLDVQLFPLHYSILSILEPLLFLQIDGHLVDLAVDSLFIFRKQKNKDACSFHMSSLPSGASTL